MKDFKSILDLKKLTTTFAVANTPMFLFINFQMNISVLEFANEFSVDEIISIFKEYSKIENSSAEDLAIVYACVMALSLKKNPKEVNNFFEQLPSLSLRWSDRIASIYFSTAKATSVEELNSPGNKVPISESNSTPFIDHEEANKTPNTILKIRSKE